MYNRIEMKQNKWSNKLIWNFFLNIFLMNLWSIQKIKTWPFIKEIYNELYIVNMHDPVGVTQLGQYETAG